MADISLCHISLSALAAEAKPPLAFWLLLARMPSLTLHSFLIFHPLLDADISLLASPADLENRRLGVIPPSPARSLISGQKLPSLRRQQQSSERSEGLDSTVTEVAIGRGLGGVLGIGEGSVGSGGGADALLGAGGGIEVLFGEAPIAAASV